MLQKDFYIGVIATMLVGAIVVITLLIKENRRLKSDNKVIISTASNSHDNSIKESTSDSPETSSDSTKKEAPNQECPDKKKAYPDASCIPLEWFDTVYKLKNDWVNKIATANLLQIKTFANLGEIVVIANCKFVYKKSDGFMLILEDPYDTIKTEPISSSKIPEEAVDSFVGNILILDGVSLDNKFKVKRIRKTNFTKKIAQPCS